MVCMLLTENNLRTIINTLLVEAKKLSQFVEEAMSEKQRNNNIKSIILNGAIDYLRGEGVNTVDDLDEYIYNKIDSRPNRKFDEYILKILYSLGIADPTGLVSRNINDLNVLMNVLYQQANAAAVKNYNEVLLSLRMISPDDNRDIPSKLTKSNLPGSGNDQNGVPKSTIVLYSEIFKSESGNSNLLNKMIEGLGSIIEVKTYAGYAIEVINFAIKSGVLDPLIKKDNVTIFEIKDFAGMLLANNIYPMKKEYSKVITQSDDEISQYLDTVSSKTNFINDYNNFKNLRPPADWCVKDQSQYSEYLVKIGEIYDDPDPNMKNKFYLILDNSKPVDNDDGACLALALRKDRLSEVDITEYTINFKIFEKYIYKNLTSKPLSDIIQIILMSDFDIFYYDDDNDVFAHFNKRSKSFISYYFNDLNKIAETQIRLDAAQLQSLQFEYSFIGNMVDLREIKGEAYNVFKKIYLVKSREDLKYDTFKEYYFATKDLIDQISSKDYYDPNFSIPVISALTWRTNFKTKTRNFLDSNSKVKEVSEVNDYYIYEILNYNDGKLSNDSLVKYNRLFKEIGIEAIAQNDPETVAKSKANYLPPFEETIEYCKNNDIKYRN